ncbi:hypothetical protein F441_18312 [Phytophthora nicotianae CJ01A1]|uniref:RxLR effector protein n=5 Tax=Phytophthora nicotianae TaxID=4792 RepID=V9E7V8_PHYNI|nr:hypothetical protein F443_18439 [Phytophthora nicotianae P1569]ETK75435.1 hypothetical protein L915_17941 [Phytophthora nicotianae]ETP05002.1 hypothetical protein F441_18312 [Phytophthora nicotianae CJ01A1]ETP33148.1 hypothetical protein F442_18267 [Phytophthora nicotianae P10297]
MNATSFIVITVAAIVCLGNLSTVTSTADLPVGRTNATTPSNSNENEERSVLNLGWLRSGFKNTPNLKTVPANGPPTSGVEGILGKASQLKPRSMTQNEITKAQRLVEKSPELRKMKSLVGTNPQTFSKEQVKSMQTFVKKNPKTGAKNLAVVFGISAVLVLVIASIVAANIALVKKS